MSRSTAPGSSSVTSTPTADPTWPSWREAVQAAGVQLVVAAQEDRHGLRDPVAVVVRTDTDIDTVVAAWAGDVSGDGRADLIVRQDPDGGGLRFRTAITKSPLPSGGNAHA